MIPSKLFFLKTRETPFFTMAFGEVCGESADQLIVKHDVWMLCFDLMLTEVALAGKENKICTEI